MTGWVLNTDYGVGLGKGILHVAVGISDDGKTIAGNGVNPDQKSEAFLVNLPPRLPAGTATTEHDFDDTDGDGIANLVQEAISPREEAVAQSSSGPIITIQQLSPTKTSLEYQRNTGIRNVEFHLEKSNDLKSWSEVTGPEIVQVVSPGRESACMFVQPASPLFVRIRVVRTFSPGDPAPEIAALSSQGELSSGGVVQFGMSPNGGGIERTITIMNTGQRDLAGVAISVTGQIAEDFRIVQNDVP